MTKKLNKIRSKLESEANFRAKVTILEIIEKTDDEFDFEVSETFRNTTEYGYKLVEQFMKYRSHLR